MTQIAARRTSRRSARNGRSHFLDPAFFPKLDEITTQDDTPVDNIFTEKSLRLLTEPLYSSWSPGRNRTFVAMANVGLFHTIGQPPLVPDVLLSLDVAVGADLLAKRNHSYFLWLMDKPPDVTIEIVSDRRGGEEDFKLQTYARWGIPYYVIFDPRQFLGKGPLRVFERRGRNYTLTESHLWPELGLGLALWTGKFEDHQQTWLRWCDLAGRVIPTGAERAVAAEAELRRLTTQRHASRRKSGK
jgi:hypothetical protein